MSHASRLCLLRVVDDVRQHSAVPKSDLVTFLAENRACIQRFLRALLSGAHHFWC